MAGRIVVGLDGSELGAAALRWAVEEARLRKATVVALHAWTFVPSSPIGEPGMVPIPAGDLVGDLEAERRAAELILDHAVAGVAASNVELVPELVEAAPGDALVAASERAELVVVGSRGRGTLSAALLGSVSHHVVQHASCPVVVVRG
jgi:nucleotide-binding universal stress UspA family protein